MRLSSFTTGPSPEYIFMLWFLLHGQLEAFGIRCITDSSWRENIGPLAFPALQSPIIGSLSVCLQSVSAQRWFVAVSLCVCPWLPQTATNCHRLPQPAIACHGGPKQTATACNRGSEFWDPLSSTTAGSKQWHAWISSYQRLQCISCGIGLVFWTKTPCFEGM